MCKSMDRRLAEELGEKANEAMTKISNKNHCNGIDETLDTDIQEPENITFKALITISPSRELSEMSLGVLVETREIILKPFRLILDFVTDIKHVEIPGNSPHSTVYSLQSVHITVAFNQHELEQHFSPLMKSHMFEFYIVTKDVEKEGQDTLHEYGLKFGEFTVTRVLSGSSVFAVELKKRKNAKDGFVRVSLFLATPDMFHDALLYAYGVTFTNIFPDDIRMFLALPVRVGGFFDLIDRKDRAVRQEGA